MTRIKATVISQEGHCSAGHKVGDQIICDWDTHEIEGRLCLHALYSVLPKVYAMAMGGNVAFAKTEDGSFVARHACPDGYNPVILELRVMD
ncbi:MAG: TIGR04076 family protein [bacterium]